MGLEPDDAMSGKLLRRAIRERVRLLKEAGPISLSVGGRVLRPGTSDYDEMILSLAGTPSTAEVRDLLIRAQKRDA
jgi:hypothetical protein